MRRCVRCDHNRSINCLEVRRSSGQFDSIERHHRIDIGRVIDAGDAEAFAEMIARLERDHAREKASTKDRVETGLEA